LIAHAKMQTKGVRAPYPKGHALEYISASRVSCWQGCRRKYYFRYVAKLPGKSSPALLVGKAVHAALQDWNLRRWKSRSEVEPHMLYAAFMRAWMECSAVDLIEWASDEAERKAFDGAWKMIQTYIEETEIPTEEPILAVETRLEAQLDDLPPIIGIIDLVRGGEDGGRIVDFKTAAKSPSASLGAHAHATQLGIYALLYRQNTGEIECGLELHHLIKTKVPKTLVTSIDAVSDSQMEQLRQLLHTYVEAVEAEDYTPSPSFMCAGCEYLGQCKSWGQEGGVVCGI